MNEKIHPEKWNEGIFQFKKYSCDFAYIDHCGNVASRTEQTMVCMGLNMEAFHEYFGQCLCCR